MQSVASWYTSIMRLTLICLFYLATELDCVLILTSSETTLKLLETNHPSNYTYVAPVDKYAVSTDYNYKKGHIYFVDGSKNIYRVGLGTNPVVIANNVMTFTSGLAVDWVNNNIYWTNWPPYLIETSSWDGSNRTTIFNDISGLYIPMAIVVDPFEGLLFWSEQGEINQVSSSELDGKKKKTVATNNIGIMGLTLDVNIKTLYSIDWDKETIYSCNYDGSNLRELFKSTSLIRQSLTLTYYSNKLYWSLAYNGQLISYDVVANKTDIFYEHEPGVNDQLRGVRVWHPSLQPNACEYKKCSHQCVLSDDSRASCTCYTGFLLTHDNRTCVEQGGPAQ